MPDDIASGDSFLNILTFNDDRLKRLDSYQIISDFNDDTAYVESTGGDKIIFFCSCRARFDWSGINSYSALTDIHCNLENESRQAPIRTGEVYTLAGASSCSVDLQTLVSEVCITSLSCDFSGTPYSGKKITDVRAYLINVNGCCSITDIKTGNPVSIINYGRLSEEDLSHFREPDILYSDIAQTLDYRELKPASSFLCYPCCGVENDAGRPPTRLVIEGRIDGTTYYWPINVGTETNGTFIIERGHKYSYDILIRRKGTTDPDTPICLHSHEIDFDIQSWTEKKDYGIEF